jgi:ribonuclease R
VPGDVNELRKTAKVAGFTIPAKPSREELQALLDGTRGTPASRAVHMAVLRTLTKAEYSPALIGHFALASSAYAHFTSPIRRYADLTVHRALAAFLERTDNGAAAPKGDKAFRSLGDVLQDDDRCPDEQALLEIARQCTMREVNSEQAERELREFLVLQFLTNHIGEEFGGVVTNVMPRGVFVQLDKYLVDGLIPKQELPGDATRSGKPPNWRIDDRTGALVDLNSGRSFSAGDRVRVCIAQIDLPRRQMDLVIADAASRAGGKGKDAHNRKGQVLGGGGGGLLAATDPHGGMAAGGGAGFKTPGSKRRSMKSKRRDKGKTEHRRDDGRKDGGGGKKK